MLVRSPEDIDTDVDSSEINGLANHTNPASSNASFTTSGVGAFR